MTRAVVRVPAPLVLAGVRLSSAPGGASAAERDVSINEVRGGGGDWVEVYNAGSAAVDVSGWRVADCDAQGRTRLARALTLPRGAVLAPAGFLLVVSERGKKKGREKTEVDRVCAPRSGTRCFKASFKISQKSGDIVRLISGDGHLLSEATYPAGTVARTQSWSRVPNGTGAFAPGEPTPGRDNVPASAR